MRIVLFLGSTIGIHFFLIYSLLYRQIGFETNKSSAPPSLALRVIAENSTNLLPRTTEARKTDSTKNTDVQAHQFLSKKYWDLIDVDVKPELLSIFQLHSKNAANSTPSLVRVAIYLSSEGYVDFVLPDDDALSNPLLEDILKELFKQRFKPATKQGSTVPSILYVELQIDGYQLHSE